MIIKTISAENFGKFDRYSVNLDDNVNVFYGNNEAGKSTLYQIISKLLFAPQTAEQMAENDSLIKIGEKYARIYAIILIDGKEVSVAREIYSNNTNLSIAESENVSSLGNVNVPFIGNLTRDMYENLHTIDYFNMATITDNVWAEIHTMIQTSNSSRRSKTYYSNNESQETSAKSKPISFGNNDFGQQIDALENEKASLIKSLEDARNKQRNMITSQDNLEALKNYLNDIEHNIELEGTFLREAKKMNELRSVIVKTQELTHELEKYKTLQPWMPNIKGNYERLSEYAKNHPKQTNEVQPQTFNKLSENIEDLHQSNNYTMSTDKPKNYQPNDFAKTDNNVNYDQSNPLSKADVKTNSNQSSDFVKTDNNVNHYQSNQLSKADVKTNSNQSNEFVKTDNKVNPYLSSHFSKGDDKTNSNQSSDFAKSDNKINPYQSTQSNEKSNVDNKKSFKRFNPYQDGSYSNSFGSFQQPKTKENTDTNSDEKSNNQNYFPSKGFADPSKRYNPYHDNDPMPTKTEINENDAFKQSSDSYNSFQTDNNSNDIKDNNNDKPRYSKSSSFKLPTQSNAVSDKDTNVSNQSNSLSVNKTVIKQAPPQIKQEVKTEVLKPIITAQQPSVSIYPALDSSLTVEQQLKKIEIELNKFNTQDIYSEKEKLSEENKQQKKDRDTAYDEYCDIAKESLTVFDNINNITKIIQEIEVSKVNKGVVKYKQLNQKQRKLEFEINKLEKDSGKNSKGLILGIVSLLCLILAMATFFIGQIVALFSPSPQLNLISQFLGDLTLGNTGISIVGTALSLISVLLLVASLVGRDTSYIGDISQKEVEIDTIQNDIRAAKKEIVTSLNSLPVDPQYLEDPNNNVINITSDLENAYNKYIELEQACDYPENSIIKKVEAYAKLHLQHPSDDVFENITKLRFKIKDIQNEKKFQEEQEKLKFQEKIKRQEQHRQEVEQKLENERLKKLEIVEQQRISEQLAQQKLEQQILRQEQQQSFEQAQQQSINREYINSTPSSVVPPIVPPVAPPIVPLVVPPIAPPVIPVVVPPVPPIVPKTTASSNPVRQSSQDILNDLTRNYQHQQNRPVEEYISPTQSYKQNVIDSKPAVEDSTNNYHNPRPDIGGPGSSIIFNKRPVTPVPPKPAYTPPVQDVSASFMPPKKDEKVLEYEKLLLLLGSNPVETINKINLLTSALHEQIVERDKMIEDVAQYNDAAVRLSTLSSSKWPYNKAAIEACRNRIDDMFEKRQQAESEIELVGQSIKPVNFGNTPQSIADEVAKIEDKIQNLKLESDKQAIAYELMQKQAEEKQKELANMNSEGQSHILEETSHYMQDLTLGKYDKVVINEEKTGLVIRDRNGEWFDSTRVRLSQATREQLYLSLRISVADMFDKKSLIFPMFFDEALITWDKQRMKAVMRLLGKISQHRQVIIFTCHEWLKDLISEHLIDAKIIEM